MATSAISAMHATSAGGLIRLLALGHLMKLSQWQSYLNTRLTRQTPLQLHHRARHLIAHTRLAAVVVHWRCCSRLTSRGSVVRARHGTASAVTVMADALRMGLCGLCGRARAGDGVRGGSFRDAGRCLVGAAKAGDEAGFAGGGCGCGVC